ncbi:MbtH family protein [Streptomyces bambusae]|uniref:MbtH family NRPS accessory protein n=1 Tax=Streptomyces bambusae TaxID=1550616 RepID=A0ABS6YY98_9ACTN|nr:MbtH family protein [Streptomyces bambusae]MBW5480454.1 MbtH family NRPS accessory protein [Streptomyces bambusae]
MATNPFEDPAGSYLVLADAEGRHSLWPAHLPVPAGWSRVHGPQPRPRCLAYVEESRTDPNRPAAAR